MADKTISDEEIDALISAVQTGQVGAPGDVSEPKVKTYDFARPDKFSKEQIRALEMIYASSARSMSTQLSTLMRTATAVESTSIVETTYESFFETTAGSAAIALLTIEPLVGRALLEMDPDITFAFIDRLLGGPGSILAESRELTEIEKGLMGRVVDRLMRCIADAWGTLVTLTPRLDVILGSQLFSQVALPDDRMVLASFSVKTGAVSGSLHFGVPVTALDPILSKLTAQQWFSAGRQTSNQAFKESIEHSLDRTDLEMVLELGRANVSIRDLLELQIGDLVCLDHKAGAELNVMLGNHVKFHGQPGLVGRRLGLQITHVVTEEN
ncbi:MAG TPA: flagellar motor switch protein FliM [Armatimonadota bacterium]|jgi:flagellar motor switch protein FliM